jgi:hypothetical protein
MSRTLRILPGVLVVSILAACESALIILGPTQVDQGIIIFIHADFLGTSQGVDADVHDLEKVEGPCPMGDEGEPPTWHDCVSSVRVQPGWQAILYRDREFRGESVVIDADVPNLRDLPGPCDGSFNDCVSSMRVMRK